VALFWGTVTEERTGNPISGAHVTFECNCGKTWEAWSDGDGNYDISPPEIAPHNGHRLTYTCYKEGYYGMGAFIDPWDGNPSM